MNSNDVSSNIDQNCTFQTPADRRWDFPVPQNPRGPRSPRAPQRTPPSAAVPESAQQTQEPRFALTRAGGAWLLTFDGQTGPLKDEQGLHYVAWLLGPPTHPPIHALDLVS